MCDINLCRDFSHELGEITYRLQCMESGRVYELSRAPGDGSLATNVVKLREELADLFAKIEGRKPSAQEELRRYFGDSMN